jgi:acyl-coenzyme A synthetase/AMP-(fatty) acid ligase
MQIISNGKSLNYSKLVSRYRTLLRTNNCITIESLDHLEHIAAYIAWKETGGCIYVQSPVLPSKQKETLHEKINRIENKDDSLIFHTSGTTGFPKTVIQSRHDIDKIQKLSEFHFGWSKQASFFNLIPAFTSGFWHVILLSLVEHDCKIILSAKQTLKDDFSQDFNLTIFVPGMVDLLRANNVKLPLQKFDMIACGASQVLPRHAAFLFENGCQVFNHVYGATEIGSPVLGHKSSQMNDKINCLKLNKNTRLLDGELIYDGHATADLFDQEDDFIKYAGRSNDIIKMNGYQCSLLLIENKVEELDEFGEVLAVPKKRAGVDYIELLYTQGNPDKDTIKKYLLPYVPECNIPLKYTKIDAVPKNALNKKLRNSMELS